MVLQNESLLPTFDYTIIQQVYVQGRTYVSKKKKEKKVRYKRILGLKQQQKKQRKIIIRTLYIVPKTNTDISKRIKTG